MTASSFPPADWLRGILTLRARGQRLREDGSSLIGMQTRGASLLLLVYLALSAAVIALTAEFEKPVLFGVGFVVLVVGLGVLLYAPGDPLPRWATALVMVAPVLTMVLTVEGLTPGSLLVLQVMANGAGVTQAFLAIRRTPVCGWVSLLLCAVTVFPVAVASDFPPGRLFLVLLTNAAVLVVASLFTTVINPTAESVTALRTQTAEEFASRAADTARLRERDAQLSHLDERVRPMLVQIAAGEPLSEAQIRDCRMMEAQLRDRIRAPGLAEPDFEDLVSAARDRGVKVRLLDDSNPPRRIGATALIAMRIRAGAELQRAHSDDEVVVRILPRGRDRLGTVQVVGDGRTRRVEYDLDGQVAAETETRCE